MRAATKKASGKLVRMTAADRRALEIGRALVQHGENWRTHETSFRELGYWIGLASAVDFSDDMAPHHAGSVLHRIHALSLEVAARRYREAYERTYPAGREDSVRWQVRLEAYLDKRRKTPSIGRLAPRDVVFADLVKPAPTKRRRVA